MDDFSVFDTTDQEVIMGLLALLHDGWTALVTASAGVVVMAPDYLGYGQSYQSPKGTGIVDLYQQAAAVTFLKSKSITETIGCTMWLDQKHRHLVILKVDWPLLPGRLPWRGSDKRF